MVGTVTITEMDCVDGVHRIGVATLDNTPSLNALTSICCFNFTIN